MRSFLLCPLLLVGLLFSNCKKTQVVQPNQTIYATLQPGNWQYDNSTKTYYNQVAVPQIDDYVTQTDGVLVYITSDNTIYEALPDVLDGVSFIYNYQKGGITVEAQGSDGSVVNPPSQTIGLKIVLVDSQAD